MASWLMDVFAAVDQPEKTTTPCPKTEEKDSVGRGGPPMQNETQFPAGGLNERYELGASSRDGLKRDEVKSFRSPGAGLVTDYRLSDPLGFPVSSRTFEP